MDNVIDTMTYYIFTHVSRSLFQKDKLLFSFLLLINILKSERLLDQSLFDFLLTSRKEEESKIENKVSDLISNETWLKAQSLMKISKRLSCLTESLITYKAEWQSILTSEDLQTIKYPPPLSDITPMEKLCLLKVFRPEKLISGIRDYIVKELSEKFVNFVTFDINQSFNDSTASTPLIFLLPGTDPLNILTSLADQRSKSLKILSLGQGQGPSAENAIEEARKSGNWVFLQNCHLAPSWMGRLEKICEDLEGKSKEKTGGSSQLSNQVGGQNYLHPSFRLFLSTYPTQDFSLLVLQSGLKMTNEPPNGLKANLKVSWTNELIGEKGFFEGNSQKKTFKNMLLGLCFFHAAMQERRSYGPLGWNIAYEFNQNDLKISARQLFNLLQLPSSSSNIPLQSLHYLIGECNYGGRITDERDRRVGQALLSSFMGSQILRDDFKFGDEFPPPKNDSYENYLLSIEKLPADEKPELYGLHPNARITKDLSESAAMFSSLMILMPPSNHSASSSSYGISSLLTLSQEIIEGLPRKFDLEVALVKYPINSGESLNILLHHELTRFNNLLKIISESVKEVELGSKGLLAMSEETEKLGKSLLKGEIPGLWKNYSYPSLKPLALYLSNLSVRLRYFQSWLDNGPPTLYWLPAFFFTNSFLTAILQNYSRKNQIAIDKLIFEFEFPSFDLNSKPIPPDYYFLRQNLPLALTSTQKDKAYIFGLYIEGGRWNAENKKLEDSLDHVLFERAPVILLKPTESNKSEGKSYRCPVYRTVERKGVLTTTGNSSNFVLNVDLESEKEAEFWVKRGTAMICELRD